MDDSDNSVGKWIGRPFIFLIFSVAPSIVFGHCRTPLDAAPYLVNGAVWFVIWLLVEAIFVRVLRRLDFPAEMAGMLLLGGMVLCAIAAGVTLGLNESNYEAMRKAIQGTGGGK